MSANTWTQRYDISPLSRRTHNNADDDKVVPRQQQSSVLQDQWMRQAVRDVHGHVQQTTGNLHYNQAAFAPRGVERSLSGFKDQSAETGRARHYDSASAHFNIEREQQYTRRYSYRERERSPPCRDGFGEYRRFRERDQWTYSHGQDRQQTQKPQEGAQDRSFDQSNYRDDRYKSYRQTEFLPKTWEAQASVQSAEFINCGQPGIFREVCPTTTAWQTGPSWYNRWPESAKYVYPNQHSQPLPWWLSVWQRQPWLTYAEFVAAAQGVDVSQQSQPAIQTVATESKSQYQNDAGWAAAQGGMPLVSRPIDFRQPQSFTRSWETVNPPRRAGFPVSKVAESKAQQPPAEGGTDWRRPWRAFNTAASETAITRDATQKPRNQFDAEGKIHFTRSQARRHSNPRLFLLPRPNPTPAYLQQSAFQPQLLPTPRKLLVILDLNGTLLYRRRNRGAYFVDRPSNKAFLQYLLANHKVMVWSSARPENVNGMCAQLFTPEQQADLVGIWSRQDLRLSPQQYNEKVQVYKQLTWVWANKAVKTTFPSVVEGKITESTPVWDQSNTVLIDDSVEKAASEPFNLVRIDEFEGTKEHMAMDVLGQVTGYLEELRWQRDVSAYIRQKPFVYDGQDV